LVTLEDLLQGLPFKVLGIRYFHHQCDPLIIDLKKLEATTILTPQGRERELMYL